MNSESSRLSARGYISGIAANGRYHFTAREAQAALGVSAAATKLALVCLAKQKVIDSPARGFYAKRMIGPRRRARDEQKTEQTLLLLIRMHLLSAAVCRRSPALPKNEQG